MPRLSLTMKTGSVIQWFKKEGENVKKGEPLVEILSDKVTYEVEAPASGVLRKILAEEGVDKSVGSTLAFIAAPDEELPETEPSAKPLPVDRIGKTTATTETRATSKEPTLASPAAKRLARQHNVDLTGLRGTGPTGRIIEEDVKRFVEEQEGSRPHVKDIIPLSGIRKTTAERVSSSIRTAPHSFIIMDVDMTKAVKLREAVGFSYTAILVYAAAKALTENPTLNSTLANGGIRVYEDINIGVAVSTEKGLLVPVMRNADKKPIAELSSHLEDLVSRARQGELSKDQMGGGTFTITNLGMYDVDMFLPIINPPEAAILAAGSIIKKPMVENDKIRIKPKLTLTLAYDHRIIDGGPAADFLKKIKEIVETIGF